MKFNLILNDYNFKWCQKFLIKKKLNIVLKLNNIKNSFDLLIHRKQKKIQIFIFFIIKRSFAFSSFPTQFIIPFLQLSIIIKFEQSCLYYTYLKNLPYWYNASISI